MNEDKNTQIVKQAYADFSRGDLPALLASFAEDIQWITPGTTELAGEWRGPQGVASFFRGLAEEWDILAFEPREYIASGDRVVVLGRYDVRSRRTGRPAASHWCMVWTLANGKVTRYQEYTDSATIEAAAAETRAPAGVPAPQA